MDFMILIGYPPDPPDHLSIIPIKKKTSVFLLALPPLSLSLFLPFTLLRLKLCQSRCSVSSFAIMLLRLKLCDHTAPSQALPISLLRPHSQRLSLSLPQSQAAAHMVVTSFWWFQIRWDLTGSMVFGGSSRWFFFWWFVGLCVDFFVVTVLIFLLLLS